MPTLKQLTCHVERGPTDSPLHEYATDYGDGVVTTYLAVPDKPTYFKIHLASRGFIAQGLAMFVFIDGKAQCNRNRLGLQIPSPGSNPQKTEIDFLVNQKEMRTDDGKWLGRPWRFEKLNTVEADDIPKLGDHTKWNTGNIEVVVLRCQSGKTDRLVYDLPPRRRPPTPEPKPATKNQPQAIPPLQPLRIKNNVKFKLKPNVTSNSESAAVSPIETAFPLLVNPEPPLQLSPVLEGPSKRSWLPKVGFWGPLLPRSTDPLPPSDGSFRMLSQLDGSSDAAPGKIIINQYHGSSDDNSGQGTMRRHHHSHQRSHSFSQGAPWHPHYHVHSPPSFTVMSTAYGYPAMPYQLPHPSTYWAAPYSGGHPAMLPATSHTYHGTDHRATRERAKTVDAEQGNSWGDTPRSQALQKNSQWDQGHGEARVDNRWGDDTVQNDTNNNEHAGWGDYDNSGGNDNSGCSNAWEGNENQDNSTDWGENVNTCGNDNWDAKNTSSNNDWKSNNDPGSNDNPGWGDKAVQTGNAAADSAWGNDSGGQNSTQRQADNSDWGTTANDTTVQTPPKWDEAPAPLSWDKGKGKGRETSSSHPLKDVLATTTAYEPLDPKRPHIKAYWTQLGVPQATTPTPPSREERRQNALERSYVVPERRVPPLPTGAASQSQLSHALQPGPGVKYSHPTKRPVYTDSMDKPYAVFCFKYRSAKRLEEILGEGLEGKETKIERGKYKEKMMALSKEEILEELLRAKKALQYDDESSIDDDAGYEGADEGEVNSVADKSKVAEEQKSKKEEPKTVVPAAPAASAEPSW